MQDFFQIFVRKQNEKCKRALDSGPTASFKTLYTQEFLSFKLYYI